MPIDPRIFQAVMTPQQEQQQVYKNQLDQLQVQQAMQKAQAQNALAQLLSHPQQQPGAGGGMGSGGLGGMDPQLLQRITALDPQLGLRLQQLQQTRLLRQVELQRYLAEGRSADQKLLQGQYHEFNQQLLPIKQMALGAYTQALDQTGDPKAALRAGQQAYLQGVEQLPQGMFGPDLLRQARGTVFNPQLFRAQVFGTHVAPPRPFSMITGPNSEQQVTLDPTTGKPVPFGPEVPRFRQRGAAAAPEGQGGKAARGWQFYQDPDTHTLYRLNPNAGLSQKLTNTGWVDDQQIDPTKLKRMGGQGQGFGSSLNQRFVNRVAGAANEGAAALISIAGMSKPNSGLFSAAAAGGGVGKNVAKAFFTPESIKRYNATIAGLAPEIAAAQNQGMAPNDEQIRNIEQAITIGPTDDLKTQQYRVSLAARYMRKALEVSETLGTPDQKTEIGKILKQLQVFPDPDAIIDGSWQKGIFGGKRGTPPPTAGRRAAATKGTVTPQLLRQYAAKHQMTPQQAATYLQEQGYAVQGP